MHLRMVEFSVSFFGHCVLDLVSRIDIESGAYLLYYLS